MTFHILIHLLFPSYAWAVMSTAKPRWPSLTPTRAYMTPLLRRPFLITAIEPIIKKINGNDIKNI